MKKDKKNDIIICYILSFIFLIIGVIIYYKNPNNYWCITFIFCGGSFFGKADEKSK